MIRNPELAVLVVQFSCIAGLLYPRESPSREVKELNGLWHFRADCREAGFEEKWYSQPLHKSGDTILMPVPSSYNDITQNSTLKNFVGWVWYDREAWVPRSWLDGKTRIMLRLESANYETLVWVNGKPIVEHSGGHLPFEGDVTSVVKADSSNTITVAVNNALTNHTIPTGHIKFHDGIKIDSQHVYAGIHRPVKLHTTPWDIHIDDITVITRLLKNGSAKLDYTIKVSGNLKPALVYHAYLLDQSTVTSNKHTVYDGMSTVHGHLTVATPTLWWPWTMSNGTAAGHLYMFQVSVNAAGQVSDTYRQPIGIRTVEVTDTQFLINGKPFYFQGFGKHEDANVRGNSLDYPLMMKDINLLLWLGANSIRTCHWPYAEEFLDLCDRHGIVVIDETPALGLKKPVHFADETLQHHLEVMGELVARDKNRPSVVMWSLANEPASNLKEAEAYFKTLADKTHSLDPTRPITFVTNQRSSVDLAVQFMDVVAFNRYYGWYHDQGFFGSIAKDLAKEIEEWYNKFKKPVMITEYGAEAIAGIHQEPPVMYSEEYQAAVYSASFPAFDKYKDSKNFIGEMIWNFQDTRSPGVGAGNKKGVLTRDRQPKLGAWVVRSRYHCLAGGQNCCASQSTFMEF